MPGDALLPTVQYPDDFQVLSRTDNPLVAPVARTPLFIADKDLVVDDCWIRYATAGGAAETAQLCYVPSGTPIGGTEVAITPTGLIDRTADTKYQLVPNTTGNIVPAGAVVFLLLSSAATVKGVCAAVRFRSRRA